VQKILAHRNANPKFRAFLGVITSAVEIISIYLTPSTELLGKGRHGYRIVFDITHSKTSSL